MVQNAENLRGFFDSFFRLPLELWTVSNDNNNTTFNNRLSSVAFSLSLHMIVDNQFSIALVILPCSESFLFFLKPPGLLGGLARPSEQRIPRNMGPTVQFRHPPVALSPA